MGFLGDLGGWKIVILVVVLLVMFGGATKLPIFAKGLGQSVRTFRKEMTGVKDDIEEEKAAKAERTSSDSTAAEPVAETVPAARAAEPTRTTTPSS